MQDQEAGHHNQNYIGNIWGWKWSFVSLGIILFMIFLMLGRYAYLKNLGRYPMDGEKVEVPLNKNSK